MYGFRNLGFNNSSSVRFQKSVVTVGDCVSPGSLRIEATIRRLLLLAGHPSPDILSSTFHLAPTTGDEQLYEGNGEQQLPTFAPRLPNPTNCALIDPRRRQRVSKRRMCQNVFYWIYLSELRRTGYAHDLSETDCGVITGDDG